MQKRDEAQIAEAQKLEAAILEDLRARTGLSYRRLGGVETSRAAIAASALPLLRDWLPRVAHLANMRAGIFSLFVTPHATDHFDFSKEQWERDEDRFAQNCLSYALAANVDGQRAKQLWMRVVELNRTSDLRLLATLTRFPEIRSEVVSALVREMDNPNRKPFELRDVADIDDPLVLQWFKDHAMSPDKDLRKLAQQVIGRKGKLPSHVRYSAEGPDRRLEMFSTEVDLDALPELLRNLSERFHCNPPIQAKRFLFVGRIGLDKWVVVDPPLKAVPNLNAWLRLEDFDTVEVVLTRASA